SRLEKEGLINYKDVPVKTKKGSSVSSDVSLIDKAKVVQFSVRDITDRKKEQEEILSLSKFTSENLSPVLRIAKDGKILYSNKAGLELLVHWDVKIGEKVPEKWQRLIKEALESAKSELLEEEVKDKIFSVVIAPVVEAGYVNLYFYNITERKKAEEELKKKIHDLERFHKFSVDRELKMKELKKEIKVLEKRLGEKS
ncbi:hypothetical protein ACFL28_03500, partial [Candidatus Omnitrophota bacterium]